MGNKRKILVYAIFAFSVIYGVWFHFLSDDKAHKPTGNIGDNKASNIVQKAAPLPVEAQTDIAAAASAQIQQIALPEGWGANPFRSLEPGPKKSAGSNSRSTVGRLHLTGISYHEDRASFAIINNRVVQASEKIGDWTVVSIYRDFVTIKKSGVIEKLTMGDML